MDISGNDFYTLQSPTNIIKALNERKSADSMKAVTENCYT